MPPKQGGVHLGVCGLPCSRQADGLHSAHGDAQCVKSERECCIVCPALCLCGQGQAPWAQLPQGHAVGLSGMCARRVVCTCTMHPPSATLFTSPSCHPCRARVALQAAQLTMQELVKQINEATAALGSKTAEHEAEAAEAKE